MTNVYKNVYVDKTGTVAGMYEADGPLKEYFDKVYVDDLYFGEKSWEKAEIKLLKDSISILLNKAKKKDCDIDLIISGDLTNQIATSNYAIRDFNIPFLGIYNACASSAEAMIIGANFIDNKSIKNCIVAATSHNTNAEKQYRNPVEYGTPKPDYATFTTTGSATALLTNKKTKIKMMSSTIGRIIDKGIKDVNNMGAVMVPAAADTIYRHLSNLKLKPNYYDLIVTGDLGLYGKKVLVDYMQKVYKIDISKNYNDCGTIIYDVFKQSVFAGGSGVACSALTCFSYLIKLMELKKIKRVLFVPTGALFSPVMFFQKESLPAIAHAVSLEMVE